LNSTVTAAVTTSTGAMTTAINLLAAKLERLENAGRLEAAAP
jgi:hypothetical protein